MFSLSPTGGGPVRKVELEWEEREYSFRLHLYCKLGPWLMDPTAMRFTLVAPDGSTLSTWWRDDAYIGRESIGHYTVDIQPLQVGTWEGRIDTYGEVGSVKTFAFETRVKGKKLYWQEVGYRLGTLPQRTLTITR